MRIEYEWYPPPRVPVKSCWPGARAWVSAVPAAASATTFDRGRAASSGRMSARGAPPTAPRACEEVLAGRTGLGERCAGGGERDNF